MDNESISKKYSMAVALYNKRLDTSSSDTMKKITVAEFNAYLVDELMAIELFMKLIIDCENNKVDFCSGHSIRDLWNKMSQNSRDVIAKNSQRKIDPTQLPGDMYTEVRYFWSEKKSKNGGNYPRTILPALRKYFEENFLSPEIKIVTDLIPVKRWDGNKWVVV